MKNYFLYARKSSEDRDKQIQSVPDQISVMKKKDNSLWINIIKVFREERSAKSPWRPVFNDMMKRIQKGEASWIISWKLDRLSRNPIDSWALQYMLQTWELEIIVTNDRNYTDTDAWLLFSVESWIWNQFILDLKKAVKRWMDYKTDTWIFCWMAPEWYLNKKDDKTIIIDSERFDMIRKMWDMMLTWSYTVKQIMYIANDDWKFKRRWTKKRPPWKLQLSWMYRMFNNIFYTWDFMWKWQIKKWTHQAMVSYEEFHRVQEMLWEKWIHIAWKRKEFAYTWFIKCWECGCAITATEKRKKAYIRKSDMGTIDMNIDMNSECTNKNHMRYTNMKSKTRKYKSQTSNATEVTDKIYTYYHCTKRKLWTENCSQKSIKLENLEEQIDNMLEHIEIMPEFKEWWLEILRDDFENDMKTKEIIQKNLQSNLNHAEKRLKNLTEALIWELIDKEEYLISKNWIKIEIEQCREKINRLNDDKDTSYEDTEKVFDFIVQARTQFNHWSLQTKREIVRALGTSWSLEGGKLHSVAFPWFKPIQKFMDEIDWKSVSLENIKTSTVKGSVSAENVVLKKWYSAVLGVRKEILKYGEKVYLPKFIMEYKAKID